jgi:putative PIN family toxin of toxin-antitoxin system
MRIVLDTNVLLVSVSERSKYHLIFKSFIQNKFHLCVSTEILSEYEEVISKVGNQILANNLLKSIENSSNTIWVNKYYNFDLIKVDPDDNKFVDCAIASNADFIITNDSHFDILKSIPFPKVEVLNIDEFHKILQVTT